MAALLFVDCPEYAALVLRRTYADLALPNAIMDRSHDWLRASDAQWSDKTKTWTFPSGATLTFGYMDHEDDKYRYQGAELGFIGWDELTQFPLTQYLYLNSRLRRAADSFVPVRVRSAGNPGGIGHEWVRDRFVLGGMHAGRPFIPAKLADNPHLDQDAYRESLAQLDDVTRAQLEDGNWDVMPSGDLFQRDWFTRQETPYTAAMRVRAWDLAATHGAGDWSAGVRMARTFDGHYIVEDIVRGRWDVGERDDRIRQTSQRDGQSVRIVIEEEPGSAGKSQTASLVTKLAGYVVTGVRPTGPKDVRARPFASQVKAGTARYLPDMAGVAAWINELVSFPTGAHDDQVDATSAAFTALTQFSSAQPAVGPQRLPAVGYRPTG